MEYKKSKNRINRGLLIAAMLILHQPISCETWRDYIWNKLFFFKKENIPLILGSGIVIAAAAYLLNKQWKGGRPPQPPPTQTLSGRHMLPRMEIPQPTKEIKLKAASALGAIPKELKQTEALRQEEKTLHQQEIEQEEIKKTIAEQAQLHEIKQQVEKLYENMPEPLKSQLQNIDRIMRELLNVDIPQAYNTIEQALNESSKEKEAFIQKAKNKCTTIQRDVELMKKSFNDALTISSQEIVCQTLVELCRHFEDIEVAIQLLNDKIQQLKTSEISLLPSAIATSVLHLDLVNQLRKAQAKIVTLENIVISFWQQTTLRNQQILSELNAVEREYANISNLHKGITAAVSSYLSDMQMAIKSCILAELQKTSKAWKNLQETIKQGIVQWLQAVAYNLAKDIPRLKIDAMFFDDMAMAIIAQAILHLGATPEEQRAWSTSGIALVREKIIQDIAEREILQLAAIEGQAVQILAQDAGGNISSWIDKNMNEYMNMISEAIKNNVLNKLGALKELIEPSLEPEIMQIPRKYIYESITRQLVEVLVKQIHARFKEKAVGV